MKEKEQNNEKRKKPRNLWPLKALLITLCISFAFNLVSELVLSDTSLVFALILTVAILIIGIFFDVIGTATTACDFEPLLSMSSRKIKGSKLAVKMVKNSDVVASICCDIIGDICGIISGVCGAAIVTVTLENPNLFLSVLIYAMISTATITGKAIGKNFAINNSLKIVMSTAKVLSIFSEK